MRNNLQRSRKFEVNNHLEDMLSLCGRRPDLSGVGLVIPLRVCILGVGRGDDVVVFGKR